MSSSSLKQKNYSLMVSLIGVVAGMAMLAYASVPLYNLFCKVTGYGGTTSTRADAPAEVLDRYVNVTFNTDIDKNLNWSFNALQENVHLAIGERRLAFFEATNHASVPVTATSVFNVTPFKTGQHFVKLQCFCFEEQTLNAGETMQFPVSFYIDPALNDDENLDDIKNITLSYTFFPVKK